MRRPAHQGLLVGKRVLIVEDESISLADETRRELESNGAVVVGPVGTVGAALELLETEQVDAAILDIHLADELVFPVAGTRRRNSFVFATGYDPSILPLKFRFRALREANGTSAPSPRLCSAMVRWTFTDTVYPSMPARRARARLTLLLMVPTGTSQRSAASFALIPWISTRSATKRKSHDGYQWPAQFMGSQLPILGRW